ncbi:putative serin endopeptidase protein [Phaeoacremonium minimum UCRPA7]|uniref:Putative serin endopeptidase protein n=1 Tax=Phaeoacremonium minimum (strain UCR-PA7) TaxID=1286976 RepID=R8BBU9_PHAM7|nr:putative serin endopeptidase protein [Phaeoacremonium minimum UCRPA7]EON96749.1 putative serin endopeptidase protein [Phaeoacremonium minimum UCRPA7]
MYLLSLLAALPAAGVYAAEQLEQKLVPIKEATIRAPNKYILEVPAADINTVSTKLANSGAKIIKTFKSEVFTGLSVESTKDNVDSLGLISQVTKAWPAARYSLGITPEGFADDAAAANYSAHAYTGVDKAHAAGITGKGVKVAIVDTGTDYTHPALGGGFGPGFKVAGGYDLVGDGEWPYYSDKEPDSDPKDSLGHGTHVAGIVAGKTEWFTGVAPDATIMSYKVFAAYDSTDEDTLIDAFLMAYNDGADIITSSIGGPSGFSDGPWALVASRLVGQGVVVTIAAGNSGQDGVFYGSSGSSGKGVVAVASMDPNVRAALPFKASFVKDGQVNVTNVGYLQGNQGDPWDVVGWSIYPISYNTTDEAQACSALPADTPDLSGYVVLARRGGCLFAQKQANLYKFGAQYILFYDTDQPMNYPTTTDYRSEIAMIEAAAGEAMIAHIKDGGNVTADFTYYPDWMVGVYNSAGGIPSYYTTWGGTYELEIKPDVAAPGANILSSYPGDQWAIMSGTSMATPYVAGIAALYISAFGGRAVHGNAIAKQITNRIVSSGRALPWQTMPPDANPVDYGYWAPVPQVGSGLVDAWRVLNYTTQLTFDNFALNDTGHHSRYQKVQITNNGKTPVTYTFSLQAAGGFDSQSSYPSFLDALWDIEPKTYVPTVSFPSGTFTVKPGESKAAQFNFAPPTGYDEAQLPIYSGKVLISGSNGEELSIPYMGAGFDLKKQLRNTVFSDTTPFQVGGVNRDDIQYFHTYDFNLSWYAQNFPKVYTELKWGTKEIRWDIFEADWKESKWSYPPEIGKNGYVGSATTFTGSNSYWNFDPASMDKEDVLSMPHMRFAALVPFSDPSHSDNWDIWKTPVITVLPYTP